MTRKVFKGASHFRDCAVVALFLSCGVATAADPTTVIRYRIDHPAQPLADSLRSIARQTGVSVLFDPAKVAGRTSRAVAGELTAGEAITRALEGSGLVAERTSDGSIVVRSVIAEGRAPTPAASAPVGPVPSARGASVMVAALSGAGDSSAELDTVSLNEASRAATSLERVEVTGSRLKRIDADGPAPVNVYTRADIDRSGQPTIERFLSSLNEASVATGEGSAGLTNGQGSVQLRGLPLGSTLVLINGRRVQAVGSSSANFFNLNLIPMAAVDRVEIVPVGSSAVYGGDALAGVVNIVLKKSLEGVVLDARVGSGKGIGDRNFSLGVGGRGDAGSFLLLGSYSKSTPLTSAERAFFLDADYRRFGGADFRGRYCTPGTVTSTTAANLPGLNSTFAAIPAVAAGQSLTLASFAATAGQANLCSGLGNANGNALIHGNETLGLHLTAERQLSAGWAAFGELTYARDRLRAEESGILLYNVLVPATNPYNPFGVPVRVTSRLGRENGVETMSRDTDFTRALAGLRGEFATGWEFEATVSTTRDDGGSTQSNITANAAASTAALASSNPAAALNPFTAGRAASDEVLRSIWPDSVRDSHGRRDQVSAFVRGSVLELPGGSVDLIAGAEAARDHYLTSNPGVFWIEGRRNVSAAYGELRVPLWRAGGEEGSGWGAGPTRELAALTVAGRHDRYSVFGSANTYQAGLELRPAKTFLLRASTATSFKPPTLQQMNVTDRSFTSEAYGLVDPLRGNAPVAGGEVLRATNPNINPESGRAQSIGVVWEPASSSGTRLGVTAWQVKIDGLIALLLPQTVVNNEALFPGFVTRAAAAGGVPGPITRVLYAEVNVGKVDTSGIDMEISHAWKAAGAKWTASASATRTRKYDVALTPGSPVAQRLGRRAQDYWAPAWKGRLAAGVDYGAWSVGVTSRYLGAYQDMAPSDRSLGNFWVHDVAATMNLKRLGLGLPLFKEASLSLAIANLADHQPEYVGTSPYYDVTQSDWRGRYASLRLSMSW